MERKEHYVENQKVVLDYIKHLTTLNTGSIVLLTVLLEKIFKNPEWKTLVVAIFISFVLSLLSLSFSALGVIRSIRTPEKITKGIVQFTSWTFISGMIFFILGIILLSAFSIKNWG